MAILPYILVACGGAVGAVMRYAAVQHITLWATERGSSFPFGTLVVNVVGSFFMGVVVALITNLITENTEVMSDGKSLYIFLATGVLGGFTTFSAFSLDTIRLLENGAFFSAVAYILLSVLAGIIALYIGLRMT